MLGPAMGTGVDRDEPWSLRTTKPSEESSSSVSAACESSASGSDEARGGDPDASFPTEGTSKASAICFACWGGEENNASSSSSSTSDSRGTPGLSRSYANCGRCADAGTAPSGGSAADILRTPANYKCPWGAVQKTISPISGSAYLVLVSETRLLVPAATTPQTSQSPHTAITACNCHFC